LIASSRGCRSAGSRNPSTRSAARAARSGITWSSAFSSRPPSLTWGLCVQLQAGH
jgi:hypothetical protein